MSSFSSPPSPPPLCILLLVNGLSPADISGVLGKLKAASKDVGTHGRREFFWTSYETIASEVSKFSNIDKDDGALFGLVKFSKHAGSDGAGSTVFEEFTRNQKGMVNAGASNVHVMMGKKFRVEEGGDDDAKSTAKEYLMCWFDGAAQTAYADITQGDECISIDADKGVYVGTRTKRKLCRGPSSTSFKTASSITDFVAALAPNAPLQSVAWNGNKPPAPNGYNVVLTGGSWSKAVLAALPENIGHQPSSSNDEIYDEFLKRKNLSLIADAESLIDKMLTDVGKGAAGAQYFVASMKDLATARKSAVLKRVYVGSDKKKFIDSARAEGDVEELFVIEPREGGGGKWEEYGCVVFETFYRLDLSVY